MSLRFEELAWADTLIGTLSLRRRIEPALDREVFEVKIDDEYLMSSLFTVAEEELARIALAELDRPDAQVLVGGLGLGYTAVAALEDPRVAGVTVVEALAPVIDWHERELLPASAELVRDPRTRLVMADFFAAVADPAQHGGAAYRRYDALLVDIDHSPRHVLSPTHAPFYEAAGLRSLGAWLTPGGVFALWSDDPPDTDFLTVLEEVFVEARAEIVTFANPLTRGESANTVYVARELRAGEPG